MLIQSVVENEAERNQNMISQYEELLDELPRGSLICRKKDYYYLKYRKDGKIYDEYIGKDSETVEMIRRKLEQRKHYAEMLSELKKEQKAIQKMLEVLS